MISEADTCRKYVLPKIYDAGWNNDQISEQKTFTDGKILVIGGKPKRKNPKRADYILRISKNFPIAVIEAKPSYKKPGEGLQQSMEYAQMLGVKFAYSTNGKGIIEHDFITGIETELCSFPSPSELWDRYRESEGIGANIEDRLLLPYYNSPGKHPRYYQEIAINRAIKSVLDGKKKVLLTLATGTGKTYIAFQIIWKLWNSRWNPQGEFRKPKILYLADRNVLIDDPKDKLFAVFGDARCKIKGEAVKSRDVYFSTYQAIAEDERRPGLFKEYSRDFFDLIVVDECHRGSSREESNWREILDYFGPAIKIGMTATPLRNDNVDTYRYFGNPIYTYTLRQGIKDGFLAPYRVHRIVSNVDATGWRPYRGELDKYDREVPDTEYHTIDFETRVSLENRNKAIANNLTEYLKKTDRFSKTIVFCADQEHAEQIRRELNNLNSDITKDYPNYVVRVVSEEGDIGRGHLESFMDIEKETPVIVTTSKLLSTGVDVPTCKNIVIVRSINSMTEFKQIIGRGTRVRDDYGKLFFDILDYTGSATKNFADCEFDGEPALISEEEMDEEGNVISEEITEEETQEEEEEVPRVRISDDSEGEQRKFYVKGGKVEIVANVVYELDDEGRRIIAVSYTDYAKKQIRSMYSSSSELKSKWGSEEERKMIIEKLNERGISFESLLEETGYYEVDPFDLMCNLAFNAPLRTRRERAENLRKNKKDFFDRYGDVAKQILDEVLEKYIEHGITQIDTDVLKIYPISKYGNIMEIAKSFGGGIELRKALFELQNLIYAY